MEITASQIARMLTEREALLSQCDELLAARDCAFCVDASAVAGELQVPRCLQRYDTQIIDRDVLHRALPNPRPARLYRTERDPAGRRSGGRARSRAYMWFGVTLVFRGDQRIRAIRTISRLTFCIVLLAMPADVRDQQCGPTYVLTPPDPQGFFPAPPPAVCRDGKGNILNTQEIPDGGCLALHGALRIDAEAHVTGVRNYCVSGQYFWSIGWICRRSRRGMKTRNEATRRITRSC